MKILACGSIVPGCDAEFRAETEQEILGQVAAHAEAEHGISDMSPELAGQVRANIRDL